MALSGTGWDYLIMSRQATLTPTRITGRRLTWCVSLPPAMSETGSRERRFFATKVEAQTFIAQTRARVLNQGTATNGLTAGQREAAAAAFRLLSGKQPPVLVEVVREHLERKKAREQSVTFAQLRDAFLAAKTGRSSAYKRQVRAGFAKFAALAKANLTTIEPSDMDHELRGAPSAARNAHLRVAKAAFNFAMKRGWALMNPVSRLDFGETRRGEVEVLSNAAVRAILTACSNRDMALLPYHMFGLFAGVRPEWR